MDGGFDGVVRNLAHFEHKNTFNMLIPYFINTRVAGELMLQRGVQTGAGG